MKKVTCLILILMLLFLAVPMSGYAGRTRGAVGAKIQVGHPVRGRYPGHGGYHSRWRYPAPGPRAYWRGTVIFGPWYPYRYYAAPPVVIQQQPPVYIEPQKEQTAYWYYCQDPQGYYPYVKNCPDGWMKVVPEPTPPNQ